MAARKDVEDQTAKQLIEAARHLKDAIERAERERVGRLEAERLREVAEAHVVRQQHETERLLKEALAQVKVEEEQTRKWKRTASRRLEEAVALADRESITRLEAERERDEALTLLRALQEQSAAQQPDLDRARQEASEELARERQARLEAERLRDEAEARLKALEEQAVRQQREAERLLKEAGLRLSQERQARLEAERLRDESDARRSAVEGQVERGRPEADRLLREEAARLVEERHARLEAERLRDHAEARRRDAELARLEAERLREQAEARWRAGVERPELPPEPRPPASAPATAAQPEQAAPVSVGRFILTPAPNGFPWLATKEASGYVNQPDGATYRDGGDPLFVLVHLDRDVESLQLRVVDAESGALRGVSAELRAVPRSAAANSFLALAWHATIQGRSQLTGPPEEPSPLPPGSYRLVVRAAVGGVAEPDYAETWTSPVVVVTAPSGSPDRR